MYLIRPVQSDDLDQLYSLAEQTSFGLTTLPRDRKLLDKRVQESVRSFSNIQLAEPKGQGYLLVMEETETGKVIGTSGIISKVGGFEPFYAYRIEISILESTTLNIRKEIPVLHLVAEHNGPSEIGSLFLHPDYRQSGNGRLLSLSRFLLMAEFPQQFDDEVIAEMRGVIDDKGESPFWNALGKHFFDLDFPKADYLSIVNKEFIGDLMPVHPIYIPLLPKEAQEAIGVVHENTRPARKLLESEGFHFNQMIDIFEAGPILHCPLELIRSVRESCRSPIVDIITTIEDQTRWHISNSSPQFRAVAASLIEQDQGVVLDQKTADALQVGIGDPIRYVAPKASSLHLGQMNSQSE